jgi:hypothetical protein
MATRGARVLPNPKPSFRDASIRDTTALWRAAASIGLVVYP